MMLQLRFRQLTGYRSRQPHPLSNPLSPGGSIKEGSKDPGHVPQHRLEHRSSSTLVNKSCLSVFAWTRPSFLSAESPNANGKQTRC